MTEETSRQENESLADNCVSAFARSTCPLAVMLDLLGDKWTLIVIRDLYRGRRRFSDFLASPEGIKRNILTDRLKRLETHGMVVKEPYQERPVRYDYVITKKGCELLPVLQAMAKWTISYYQGVRQLPEQFYELKPEELYMRLRADSTTN